MKKFLCVLLTAVFALSLGSDAWAMLLIDSKTMECRVGQTGKDFVTFFVISSLGAVTSCGITIQDDLPPGLKFENVGVTGRIGGTPTQAGTYTLRVTASASVLKSGGYVNDTGSTQVTLTILPASDSNNGTSNNDSDNKTDNDTGNNNTDDNNTDNGKDTDTGDNNTDGKTDTDNKTDTDTEKDNGTQDDNGGGTGTNTDETTQNNSTTGSAIDETTQKKIAENFNVNVNTINFITQTDIRTVTAPSDTVKNAVTSEDFEISDNLTAINVTKVGRQALQVSLPSAIQDKNISDVKIYFVSKTAAGLGAVNTSALPTGMTEGVLLDSNGGEITTTIPSTTAIASANLDSTGESNEYLAQKKADSSSSSGGSSGGGCNAGFGIFGLLISIAAFKTRPSFSKNAMRD